MEKLNKYPHYKTNIEGEMVCCHLEQDETEQADLLAASKYYVTLSQRQTLHKK